MSDNLSDEDFQLWLDEMPVDAFKALVLERNDLFARVARLEAERDAAQEAAETYHAAWVGESVARLPAARVAQRHECVHLVKPGPFKYIAFCSGHTKNDRETTVDPAKVTCAKCKRLLKERE